MKIQQFVTILLLICFCMAAKAQDIIVTKDSRRIQAEILDVSPSTIRYRVYGKPNAPIVSIPVREVESVVYQSDIEPDDSEFDEEESPKKRRERSEPSNILLHGYIESAYSYNTRYSISAIDPVRFAIGAQINERIFVGGGMGFSLFPNNIIESHFEKFDTSFWEVRDEISRFKITTSAVLRYSYPINRIFACFLDVESGLLLCRRVWTREWFGSMFVTASVGIAISHFEISAGYEYFRLPLDRKFKPYQEWTFFNNSSHPNGTLNFGNLFVKVGAKIGYTKK